MTLERSLLDIQGLEIATGNGNRIVHGIDLSLAAGTIGALVGESGSGKTMAARAIMKLLPPGLEIASGQIVLDGEDIVAASARRMRQLRGPSAGMVFQEPMVTLNPVITTGAQMAEAMRLHTKLSRDEIRDRSIAMLERVQLRDPASALAAFPHEFSGGMRQRILLASVMMLRPKLLIADEPTTALDTLSQREVLDLMVGLAHESGAAVLLITHNLGLVSRYTQNMTVLRSGRIVEHGPTTRLVRAAADPYTRELINAAAKVDLSPLPVVGKAEEVLGASNVTVRYRNRATGADFDAVDSVSLGVAKGETVAIVGASGSGKTTLGRALLGIVKASAGRVRFKGHDLLDTAGRVERQARLECQLIFQDPYSSLNPRHRIGRIVREPLRHLGKMTEAEKDRRTSEVLGEVGLSGLEARFPHQLSGGQRQRVAIARALVRRPSLVVADEPVSALDMTIQAQVLDLLRELQAQYGFACIFISHDLTAVRRVAHRIIVMQSGRIVEEGRAGTILDRPEHPYSRALVDASPSIERPDGASAAGVEG
ncbi:MAG: dipeptide ABC transporter ATP-binding protein [Neoaquamicrobium sediminum]|uniref:dipeptide ABC transporter ATP-binding protein n=1 Tax=Neoaquamicrobium sediminum TaxID=1849104 RepID=UPI004035ED1C